MLQYGILHPKLILFGEYSVLLNGEALTLPLKNFSAQFNFIDEASDMELAGKSNQNLKNFTEYLISQKNIATVLYTGDLAKDISEGLYIQSNVPQGYGLGSSGVVCALIVKTYFRQKTKIEFNTDNFSELKKLFVAMETYFHGQSSGVDPLACYLGRPLLFTAEEVKPISENIINDPGWFLVDTRITRKTNSLVHAFKKKLDNHFFKHEIESNYLPLVSELISRKLHSASENLTDWATTQTLPTLMEGLSLMQLRYFEEMIPCELLALWQNGLDTGNYYLKLLGAGGGGYFLGFAHDIEFTRSTFESCGFRVIPIKV